MPTRRGRFMIRCYRSRLLKFLLLGTASLPLFQTTGCYPDFGAAVNFELQLLINTTLITAVNTVVQNFLHL